jgi:hypothetical protein
MHVDLDNPLDQPQPWRFSAKFGGVVFSTREPSIEEKELLRKPDSIHTCRELIWTLFVDPRPAKSSLTDGRVYSLVLNLSGYITARKMIALQIANRLAAKPPPPGHAIQRPAPPAAGSLPN